MPKQDNIHVQLCAWSPSYQRLLNMKTYEGLDQPVEAFGFDEKGEAVFRKDAPTLKYKIVGVTPTIRVDLSATATLGVRADMRRNVNGKLIIPPKVYGFQAMEIMLGRNGCSAPKDLEERITSLIANGMKRIWVYRESNARGMAQAYGFSDFWNISSTPPTSDYDEFNAFLKTIKSDYQIITNKAINALRRLELNKLMKTEE